MIILVITFMQGIYVTQTMYGSVFTVCATCNVISPVKYVLYFQNGARGGAVG
jgi:hypothetical protein